MRQPWMTRGMQVLMALSVTGLACSGSSGGGGTGGRSGSGGVASSGGTSGTGGVPGTGGIGTGGTPATGGATSSGGAAGGTSSPGGAAVGAGGAGGGHGASGGQAGSGSGGIGSGGGGAGGKAGSGGGGGADPLNAAATCTSGIHWTTADGNTFNMRPGEGCSTTADCHGAGATSIKWGVAGTVYPTGHEPDDCNGFNVTLPGADLIHVVITDANGTEVSMLPNQAGNFYLSQSVAFPASAKVTGGGGKERVMTTPLTSGDCNSCHTQAGANAAPGRITVPF